MTHRSDPDRREHPDAYTAGYMQGVADAGARLIGAVAAELGQDHPLVDKLVVRLGGLGVGESPDEGVGV
jgi:hypothetical protein